MNPLKTITLCLSFCCSLVSTAQVLTTPPAGGSVRASVSEQIGLTNVAINYSRPGVKGREGKIWGQLVPEGGSQPWRAGANENTTIEFSTEVRIEGETVPAGKYGFFIVYGAEESTLILSSNSTSWGSAFYDSSEDVARIKVKPVKSDHHAERLVYAFTAQQDSSATVVLSWERLSIPFTISVDLQKNQLASFEREMRTVKGYDPQAMAQVAEYLLEHNIQLDKALGYINAAITRLPSFRSYIIKAEILEKMNAQDESRQALQQAVYYGNVHQVYYYGMGQLRKQHNERALYLLKENHSKNPDIHLAKIGLIKAYLAVHDGKNATRIADNALKSANKEQQEEIRKLLAEEQN